VELRQRIRSEIKHLHLAGIQQKDEMFKDFLFLVEIQLDGNLIGSAGLFSEDVQDFLRNTCGGMTFLCFTYRTLTAIL
jgi:hypothetical protein